MAKVRADQLLVARGLVESRARAQALILAGLVFSGERRVAKAGEMLADTSPLDVRGRDHPWVSRGGLKLAAALDAFAIAPEGAWMDVGAATGGFTDVLLARGAERVYAVDVGTGQLAWKLRCDPRVVVLEKVNARALTAAHIPEPVAGIVCDASFIGLAKVLEVPLRFARSGAFLVALIKPQFEAERAEVGKGGIVRDPQVQARVCAQAAAWIAAHGWAHLGTLPSPITGADGNVEFLLAARKSVEAAEPAPPPPMSGATAGKG
ncbi:TlyA family RNA methyltransferase [Thermaurantiacus sp.]